MGIKEYIIYMIYGRFGYIPRSDSNVNILVQTAILAEYKGIDFEDILNFTEKYKNKGPFGVIYYQAGRPERK